MENDVVYSVDQGKWVDKDRKIKIAILHFKFLLSYYLNLKVMHLMLKSSYISALFAERARVATSDAAKMAGIEVISLINEPTAAACYYASLPNVKNNRKNFGI